MQIMPKKGHVQDQEIETLRRKLEQMYSAAKNVINWVGQIAISI